MPWIAEMFPRLLASVAGHLSVGLSRSVLAVGGPEMQPEQRHRPEVDDGGEGEPRRAGRAHDPVFDVLADDASTPSLDGTVRDARPSASRRSSVASVSSTHEGADS